MLNQIVGHYRIVEKSRSGTWEEMMVRLVATMIAVVGWIGLAIQFYLLVRPENEPARTLVSAASIFFSFFTILTNLLVASVLTIVAVSPGALGRPGSKVRSLAAACVGYISLVGIVYSLVLRALWNPAGLQKVADVILHDVVPIAYVLYWILLAPKGHLHWRVVPGLARLSTRVRGLLGGPRRADQLVSLSVPRCLGPRLPTRGHQHRRLDDRVCGAGTGRRVVRPHAGAESPDGAMRRESPE